MSVHGADLTPVAVVRPIPGASLRALGRQGYLQAAAGDDILYVLNVHGSP